MTFSVGEYDMAIYDSRENTCECYEIKHSDQIVSAQTKYLIDEEMLNQTTVSMNCSGSVLKFLPLWYILCIYHKGRGVFMQAQVKTWGNSQGIRIPKEALQEANVKINDVLDVRVADGMIMLVKPFRHKTLEERAAEFDGKLNLDGEFDWDEPVGREVW